MSVTFGLTFILNGWILLPSSEERHMVEKVIQRLVSIAAWLDHTPTEDDLNSIRELAEHWKKKGWSDDDLVAYFKNSEEINPELAEDIAIRRMQVIVDKYKR